MSSEPSYANLAILFIDDEEQSQKYFSQIFGQTFKIHLASDGEEGLKLFHEHRDEIGVVVSDQRMPGISGSELLSTISELSQDVVNILSTAYSDLDAAIDAVNRGGIYRYVTKPWDLAELDVTLRRAMDYYRLREQHRALARTKISGLEKIFQQSRLMACVAIPALLENDSSIVRMFRDLLRLSLDQENNTNSGGLLSDESLSPDDRQALSNKIKEQLGQLVSLAGNRSGLSEDQLSDFEQRLNAVDEKSGRLSVVQAFLALLQGRSSSADQELLADLVAIYRDGQEIHRSDPLWTLKPSDQAKAAPSVSDALYDLFVDDAFLVSLVLGEI